MRSCLIADDHAMMREALGGAVGYSWPQAKVTLANDFPSAWAGAETHPDLIISDLVMPGAPSLEGIRRLREISPGSPILVVTGNEDDQTLLALFHLGIAGFAPKTSESSVIEAIIRLVLAGARYLPPRVMELAAQREGDPPSAAIGRPRLTDRQIDVLRLISAGQSNKQIARELDLSPATIKAHTAAAMAALGAANRAEAVFRASEQGLI